MNDMPHPDDARRKAVLAAVLAVQRGFLSPDEAVRALGDLGNAGHMQTLLEVAPAADRAALATQVEALASDPEAQTKHLSELGVTPQAQSTLFSVGAGSGDGSSIAETLKAITRGPGRVTHLSSRLQKVGENTGEVQRYEIKREYARGGMGRILVALDNAVGREVALKELLSGGGSTSGGSAGTSAASPELVERFVREAKVTGQLEHPNIVPVYEIGVRDDGSVFYTMKLIRGKTLASRLAVIQRDPHLTRQQKLSERLKLLDPFVDVCNAIAYAHSRVVVHRDLKPANIMLGDFGETLVLDWGLARVRGHEERKAASDEPAKPAADFSPSLLKDDSAHRTLDGAVLGTPAYMPPEQARGELENVDEKSDVYALGAILYEILCGRAPFDGPSAQTVLAKVLVTEPEAVQSIEPNAPPDLVSLVRAAMQRDRDARLAGARELGAEVLAFRDGRNLSVYRYSSSQLIRRFVRRNAAAVAVAGIGLALLAAGGLYAVSSILAERDTVQSALRSAEHEASERQRLEAAQAESRRNLIAQRETEIAGVLGRIAGEDADALLAMARARITALEALAATEAGQAPPDKHENEALVSRMLQHAQQRQARIALWTEPVAGLRHEFVSTFELQRERARVAEIRLAASRLAMLNQDFALARVLIDETESDAATISAQLALLAEARGALLKHRAEEITAALNDVRADLARRDRPKGMPRLEDYVMRFSSWHDVQTADLLAEALQPLTQKAQQPGEKLWTQPERDLLLLICRVMMHIRQPDRCAPVLATFLASADDTTMAIECGVALAYSGHELAWQALVNARARWGEASLFWVKVQSPFARVPEPADLPPPQTPTEAALRARLRLDQGRTETARELLAAARERWPGDAELAVQYSRTEPADAAMELLQQTIESAPGHAGARRELARRFWGAGKKAETLLQLDVAVELEPKDWRGWSMRAFYRGFGEGDSQGALEDAHRSIELMPYHAPLYANRAAYYIALKDYERAAADCTRAIELDPRHPEAYINRGVARMELGDKQGALLDLTHVLELVPGQSWGYINRGRLRHELGDYAGAVLDLNYTIARNPNELPHAFLFRGRAHAKLDNREQALADLREYLRRVPDTEERAAVEAEIAKLEK